MCLYTRETEACQVQSAHLVTEAVLVFPDHPACLATQGRVVNNWKDLVNQTQLMLEHSTDPVIRDKKYAVTIVVVYTISRSSKIVTMSGQCVICQVNVRS